MLCPLGHGELQPETRVGLAVHVCPSCQGEWLRHEDLTALEGTAVRDAVVLSGTLEYQPHGSERSCPVCAEAMYEFDYRGNPLELDACPNSHGYWLDAGEDDRVRGLIRQRARDLHRAATAQASFGVFLKGLQQQVSNRTRRP
jgi:Zn-finger nucleic acid-binding protein